MKYLYNVRITAQIEAFATFKQEFVLVIQDMRAMIVLKYIFNA